MKIRTELLILLSVAGLLAAGCAGRVDASQQEGAGVAVTASSGSPAAIGTGSASPKPSTSNQPAVPSSTNEPSLGLDSGGDDYGYGGDDYGYGGDATAPAVVSENTPSEQVKVGATISKLGMILVDGRGHTLYALTMDSPGVSTCSGSCLETWPPLLHQGAPIAGDGVQSSSIGTMSRSDGGEQITYNGKPLYTYSGDQTAGDLNGQGKGGVWFAVTVEGDFAR